MASAAHNLKVVTDPLPPHLRRRAGTKALTERLLDGRLLYREDDGTTPIYDPATGNHARRAQDVITRAYALQRGDDFSRSELADVKAYAEASAVDKIPPPPELINTKTGLLDVTTRKMYQHSPRFHSTTQLPVTYNPRAQGTALPHFFMSVLATDALPRILEHVGNTINHMSNMQRAVILQGDGANGKSALLGLLLTFGGWANFSFATAHQIAEDDYAAEMLTGKLGNIAADLEGTELRRGTGKLKAIISGDPIITRRIYGEPRSSVITSRLWFSCNTPPPTSDITPGFFRRWDFFPFEQTFTPETADVDLLQKLTTDVELSSLLNLALDGLDRLRQNGTFSPSPTVDAANARYRTDADSVAAFVEVHVAIGPDHDISGARLFDAYTAFCIATGRRACALKSFYSRLLAVPSLQGQIEKTTAQRAVLLRGVGLR